MFRRTPEPDGSESAPFGQLTESDVRIEVDYIEGLIIGILPVELREPIRERAAGIASNELLTSAEKVQQLADLYWQLVLRYHPDFQNKRIKAIGAAVSGFVQRLQQLPVRLKGTGPYVHPDRGLIHPSMREPDMTKKPSDQDSDENTE